MKLETYRFLSTIYDKINIENKIEKFNNVVQNLVGISDISCDDIRDFILLIDFINSNFYRLLNNKITLINKFNLSYEYLKVNHTEEYCFKILDLLYDITDNYYEDEDNEVYLNLLNLKINSTDEDIRVNAQLNSIKFKRKNKRSIDDFDDIDQIFSNHNDLPF